MRSASASSVLLSSPTRQIERQRSALQQYSASAAMSPGSSGGGSLGDSSPGGSTPVAFAARIDEARRAAAASASSSASRLQDGDTDAATTLSLGECPVCLDTLLESNSHHLRCGHLFHRSCLLDWVGTATTYTSEIRACPVCRCPIEASEYLVAAVRSHGVVRSASPHNYTIHT